MGPSSGGATCSAVCGGECADAHRPRRHEREVIEMTQIKLLVIMPMPDDEQPDESSRDTTSRPGYLLLENVAVLPAVQGRGIGARLLALAEDRARALHVPEIRLYTNAAMTENLAYCPQHGYTETHRAQQDGFHRVFFRKRVDT